MCVVVGGEGGGGGGGGGGGSSEGARKYEKFVSTVDPHSPVPWHRNATMQADYADGLTAAWGSTKLGWGGG